MVWFKILSKKDFNFRRKCCEKSLEFCEISLILVLQPTWFRLLTALILNLVEAKSIKWQSRFQIILRFDITKGIKGLKIDDFPLIFHNFSANDNPVHTCEMPMVSNSCKINAIGQVSVLLPH